MTAAGGGSLERLREVMHAIRQGCPWDAEQTHTSVSYTHLTLPTSDLV